MSAHTPTPWTFEPPAKDSDWQGAIKGPGGVEVCSFGDATQYYPTEGCPPDEDDAEFLLRAVNAHHDLREALQRFVDLADAEYLGTEARAAHAVKVARAALAKAASK